MYWQHVAEAWPTSATRKREVPPDWFNAQISQKQDHLMPPFHVWLLCVAVLVAVCQVRFAKEHDAHMKAWYESARRTEERIRKGQSFVPSLVEEGDQPLEAEDTLFMEALERRISECGEDQAQDAKQPTEGYNGMHDAGKGWKFGWKKKAKEA